MKFSDFLQDIGRPVAYYPNLRKITGSTNATILLCQFFYWRGKEESKDGWLYKTAEEIEQETGLSYEEQKTARAKLRANDLMEERYARLDHKMYFRLKLESINAVWGMGEKPAPESGNATFGSGQKPRSLNSNTETTTQTTTKNERFESVVAKLSELGGGVLNSTTADFINEWLPRHEDQWIFLAIELAKKNGARAAKYVDTTLCGWESNGYPKSREERGKTGKKSKVNFYEALGVQQNG